MRKSTSLVFAFVLFGASLFVASTSHAQVTAEVRDGTVVILAAEPVEAAGLDLNSPAGRLVPIPDPASASPFTFFLANSPNQITWGNLGTSTTLDGAFNTRAGYTGDPVGDLTAAWGDGLTPVDIPVSLSGEVTPTPDPPVVVPPTPDPPVVDPPVGGNPDPVPGPLAGSINEDGFIVLSASESLAVAGIDLQSAAGNLVPISDEVGSAPFAFFLSNTPNQITWGNLGSTVTLEGDFVTGAQYNGDDPAGDLTAFWGDGPTPVAFAIGAAGGVAPVVPEPSGISLASLALLGLLGLRTRRK